MTFTAAVDAFTRDVFLVVNTVRYDIDDWYDDSRVTAWRVTAGPHPLDIPALRTCAAVVRFVTIMNGSHDVEVLDAAERLDAALSWTR